MKIENMNFESKKTRLAFTHIEIYLYAVNQTATKKYLKNKSDATTKKIFIINKDK